MRRLTSAQMDRACGVLLAAACGDALGAGYEFGSARLEAEPDLQLLDGEQGHVSVCTALSPR